MTESTSEPVAAADERADAAEPAPATSSPAASAAPASPAAAPAAGPGSLTLTPPEAVTRVEGPQAESKVPLDKDELARLDAMVERYIDTVTSLDPHAPAFTAHVEDIRKLGDDEVRKSASVSSRLLDKPLNAMKSGGLSAASEVSTSLRNLRRTVEELDPKRQGDLLSRSKLFGVIPFGNKLRDYFGKYQSSQAQIDAIIQGLYHGQDELQKDNADLEQVKATLWTTMGRLRQYAYMAERLDEGLSRKIAEIETTDPERAKALKDDFLFPVRQKHQDLLTQLSVSVQGYLAMDVIRRTNMELIKGVDRATTTTVSALRTAVIVAQALANQKLVLDQITALNETTGRLIESTSEMLRQQSGEVMQQAGSSTIELARLQKAFDNVYATMDEIDTFKVKALDNMSQTIDALNAQVDKAQQYVDRVRERDAHDASGDLELKV
jgi:uncharacterized protein YaaN involved in tellurite resistance